jgi:hypothetical protein
MASRRQRASHQPTQPVKNVIRRTSTAWAQIEKLLAGLGGLGVVGMPMRRPKRNRALRLYPSRSAASSQ